MRKKSTSPRRRSEPGFDAKRLEHVRTLCRDTAASGEVPGMALVVARHGRTILNEAWGYADRAGTRSATPDTVWLTASVTKPVVCSGILLLLERGLLTLDDPAHGFIPELHGTEHASITLRHLLTHTSGLPDMLPENLELRMQHAPHAEFVRRICATPLLFTPGTEIRYQSTGIALLGEIIERITGKRCREFLADEFFTPLGMSGTALGWKTDFGERVAECILPVDSPATTWDWNSPYWRDFGAPWGGMFATAAEMATFLQMYLNGGAWEGRRYLGTATVATSHRNHTAFMPTLPEPMKTREGWGLGWQLASPVRRDYLGDISSPSSYGHLGATGTGVWNDPESGVSMVLFTNRPECWRFIGRVSSSVAAAAI